MTPDLFWIPGPWRGNLAVSTRPRGGDWAEDEARGWREAGIEIVVSLLEANEAAELGLACEGEAAQAAGIRFLSFPIPDRDVPSTMASARTLLKQLSGELQAGHKVAIHCRQGIGRSGLIAVGILAAAGVDVESAIRTVSTARGLTIPETPAQLDWLRRLPTEDRVTI